MLEWDSENYPTIRRYPTKVGANFDATGGLKPSSEVISSWTMAAREAWADPGRMHHQGRQANLYLQTARASIATDLNISADEVYFAANITGAIRALLRGAVRNSQLVISTPIESAIVLDELKNYDHSLIAVDELGRLDPTGRKHQTGQVISGSPTELNPHQKIAALCIQGGNVEVGTKHNLNDFAALFDGVPIISDHTGILGWVHLSELPANVAYFANAQDWGGVSGAVVVIIPRAHPFIYSQINRLGWLGGAANVPAAVAAATALSMAMKSAVEDQKHLFEISKLLRNLLSTIPDVVVHGDPHSRLAQIVSASALYVAGEAVVQELDRRGFEVASGSACSADDSEPSHVLAAMNVLTSGNIRISLPKDTTAPQIHELAVNYAQVISELKEGYL